MAMRTWLLALMTVLVAFSGCFGGDDGGDDTTTTPTATSTGTSTQTTTTTTSTTSTSTQTGEPEPDENTPPTASISASIEQGQIPFDVNFTLDGADVDGDDLAWTFDADEDGTFDAEGAELPAEYTHTYDSEGTFNATLTVSDGTNETVLVLEIDATAAAAAMGPIQEASLEWAPGNSGCGGPYDMWAFDTPAAGALFGELALDVDAVGGRFTIDMAGAVTAVGFIAYDFYDASGALLAGGSYAFAPELSEKGTVPADAAYVLFNDCATQGGASAHIVIS